jgi:hypothetical protein
MKINDYDRQGHLQLRPNFYHMTIGGVLVTFLLFVYAKLLCIFDIPALFSIVFFNLLFVFFLFPLEGPLFRKVVLLIAGNIVGNIWYTIQLLFEDTLLVLDANSLKVMALIAKPFLDFVWIVAVWSFSLSVLATYKIKAERMEKI